MSIATHTLLSLVQSLAEANGDWLTFSTTTNIAGSSTVVISTTLNQYDNASDDFFNEQYWFYLDSTNNASVLRKVKDYATATGSLTMYGANLAAESGSQTCYLFRYDRSHYVNAIVEACKEIYPSLHVKVDDMTLVSSNILPDGHFESWSSATALNQWTASNITLAKTSTAGLTRGGAFSAKCTATAANGYIYVHSDTFPRLLQLQNTTVNAYAQAYPQTADDAAIVIYTKDKNGTEQTLTSTTSCQAGEFTQLKLEGQTLNDNLTDLSLRLKVGTSGQYVYFDDAYLGGRRLTEFLMPDDLVGGSLSQVIAQIRGNSDPMFYDTRPFMADNSGRRVSFTEINDGTNIYLKLLEDVPAERRLRLIGRKPLELATDTSIADTDTITLDAQCVPLLIQKAKMIFYEREITPLNAEDSARFEREQGKAEGRYRQLLKLAMPLGAERIKDARVTV